VRFLATIRVDQGSELVSRDLIFGPISAVSRSTSPGPENRPTTRSLNHSTGKFRAECLNAHWFMTLDDARRKCEA
jgi:putative transposase